MVNGKSEEGIHAEHRGRDYRTEADRYSDRIPPQSTESEMAVLGAMLLDEKAIVKATTCIKPDDFYRKAHRSIFNGILSLFNRGENVDLVTLTEELRRQGFLDEIGGASYIAGLVDAVPSVANVGDYARIVRDKSDLRKVIGLCTQTAAEAYEGGGELGAKEFLARAQEQFFNIVSYKDEERTMAVGGLVHDVLDDIEKASQRGKYVTGISTGFYNLDEMTTGLHEGELVIIAGRPSSGKSSLMANIATHVAFEQKIPVAIFSLEMTRKNLMERIFSSEARVDGHQMRTGHLAESAFPKLATVAGRIAEAQQNLYINDTPGISELQLRAIARNLKIHNDIKLIFVDYLQLMEFSGKAENKTREVTEISKSLKRTARELNIPLVVCSQLSRAPERREDPKPRLSDLRDSGAIEQDADVVLMIHRPEYYEPSPENQGLAELNIAKQRNGPVGEIRLVFHQKYTRFVDLARPDVA